MKRLFALSLFILLFALGACAKEPVVLEDRSHPQITVLYASEDVLKCVAVTSSVLDSSAKLPRCVVRLKNLAPGTLPLEYQAVWEDAYGAPLLNKAAWQRMTIAQNGEKTIVDVAKAPQAQRVTVTLRFPVDVQIWVPDPAQNAR